MNLENKNITNYQYQILSYLKYDNIFNTENFDIYLYLYNTPQNIFTYIQKRNLIDKNITLKYVEKLHRRYEIWIKKQNQKNIIFIDSSNYDFKSSYDVSTKILPLLQANAS